MAFNATIVAEDKRKENEAFNQQFNFGGLQEGKLQIIGWSFSQVQFKESVTNCPIFLTNKNIPVYASSLFKVKLDKNAKPHTAHGAAVEAMKKAADSITDKTNENVMDAMFAQVKDKILNLTKDYFLTDNGQASVLVIDFV